MTIDPILLTALSTMLGKLAKSAGPLNPGSYTVDETVVLRIAGTVDKADDESYVPTVDIPMLATLALFIEGLRGKVQELQLATIMETLTESMTSAITADVKASPVLASRLKDIDGVMARVRSMTNALPEKTRTGKTKVDATMVALPAATPVAP
jgi:hypothetical protein